MLESFSSPTPLLELFLSIPSFDNVDVVAVDAVALMPFTMCYKKKGKYEQRYSGVQCSGYLQGYEGDR